MRINIKKHHHTFITRLANQMECPEAEALNYILTELKRINYSFHGGLALGVGTAAPVIPAVANYVEQHFSELADPQLQRLISLGLEEF